MPNGKTWLPLFLWDNRETERQRDRLRSFSWGPGFGRFDDFTQQHTAIHISLHHNGAQNFAQTLAQVLLWGGAPSKRYGIDPCFHCHQQNVRSLWTSLSIHRPPDNVSAVGLLFHKCSLCHFGHLLLPQSKATGGRSCEKLTFKHRRESRKGEDHCYFRCSVHSGFLHRPCFYGLLGKGLACWRVWFGQ